MNPHSFTFALRLVSVQWESFPVTSYNSYSRSRLTTRPARKRSFLPFPAYLEKASSSLVRSCLILLSGKDYNIIVVGWLYEFLLRETAVILHHHTLGPEAEPSSRRANSPTAKQLNSPTAQQPNNPTAQQPNSPTGQQPDSPTAQQAAS